MTETNRADLMRALRKMERARRAYLNGPVSDRTRLRAEYYAAAQGYEKLRTGRTESLADRWRRLRT